MPCESSYLAETDEELYLRRTANLIIFVLKKLGGTIPKWVKEESKKHYVKDRRLIIYLCSLLKGLTKEQEDKIVYNARDKVSRDLADWWEEHKEHDRRREEAEIHKKRVEQLQKSARAKLTKEELKALLEE